MRKNQNLFKIRINENSLLENIVFFKDYLISSNILDSNFSNLTIIYYNQDNFIENILKAKVFPKTIFFQLTKENFKNIIKLHNKDFSNSKTKISLIILPKEITENGQLIKSYEKKIIHKIKAHFKFIITNVPENCFVKKIPSWTQNVIDGKFKHTK